MTESQGVTTGHRSTPIADRENAPLRPRPWRPGVATAGLMGLIAIGLAVAVAELVAALGVWVGVLHVNSSPLAALGATFIQFTPEWLKEQAIQAFGTNDKLALRVGMMITLAILAGLIGVLARRSPRPAVVLTVVLLAVTAAAVLTRTGTGPIDVLPTAVGGIVGIVFLVSVFRRTVVRDDVSVGTVTATAATAGGTTTDTDRSGAAHPMLAASPARTTDRRTFFRMAGVGAVVAVAAGAVARWIPSTAEVAASRDRVALGAASDVQTVGDVALQVDDLSPFVTPNDGFYRIDTAFTLPRITAEDWQLRIHGLVDREITLNFADLMARPMLERMVTLTCVSNEVGGNLVGNARWQGIRLDDLLAEAGPQAGADAVLSTSVDGMTIGTPLAALTDGRDAILAVAMNGEPLPVEHGFPVRMVVPGLYGYVSATKWVVDLEVTRFADFSAYWTDRGWSAQGPIKTGSRIDVPKSFDRLPAGKVAVAGVAWAQHRGISAVEVQVDQGDWVQAELSGLVSVDTWRQYVYQWDATPGLHTVRVRAIDDAGEVQTDQLAGVLPDGATGWDSRTVTIV
ncbi:molybdopterin-dependent oxidoreductase [Nakamurella flavida]|uniref:Molybdopterin-dependent oxidoreductase n=1 Tax=Nakamurella flavida TaxID=363630 RepID=A0A939C6X1_9ACTN|nr:molybdopterin-dependent oxidoreductase [Nakamurella flavida]MBM9477572.1 molybdopterin-dependent oxidoreductase [Nakamurella flavida]MDP9779120.1 DMSO/TMAO reductase YedYZ molybdopterin-dependent catalytic subunit [Nakamurella flavida]